MRVVAKQRIAEHTVTRGVLEPQPSIDDAAEVGVDRLYTEPLCLQYWEIESVRLFD
jgi:hypothetical protein